MKAIIKLLLIVTITIFSTQIISCGKVIKGISKYGPDAAVTVTREAIRNNNNEKIKKQKNKTYNEVKKYNVQTNGFWSSYILDENGKKYGVLECTVDDGILMVLFDKDYFYITLKQRKYTSYNASNSISKIEFKVDQTKNYLITNNEVNSYMNDRYVYFGSGLDVQMLINCQKGRNLVLKIDGKYYNFPLKGFTAASNRAFSFVN